MISFIVLLLVPLLLVFLKNLLFRSSQKLPPGPNVGQVLLNLHKIAQKPHIQFKKIAQSYGPLVSFRIGTQLIVIASSPETAKELTKTHDRVFSGRHLPTVYQYLPGSTHSSIVLSPKCDKSWKLLRSMGQNSIFSSLVTEKKASIRKTQVSDVVNFVRSKEGQVVNLEEIMFAALINIMSGIMTSTNLFDIQGQDTNDFKEMMATVNEVIEKSTIPGVVDYLPILKWVDFWSKGKAMEFHTKINQTWGHIIQDRRSGGSSHSNSSNQDFLDALIATSEFSDDQMANVLTEVLVGATDSTSITTEWLIVELIRNQEILHRVRDEIAETVQKDELLSDTLLSECQYFQACIKETLRLHVPAPLLVPHRATETREVNNYVIPEDSMLFVNAWAIARDPEYWEDAESFKPERFLDSNIGFKGTHFEYLPFGTGLRTCPGSNVAFKNIQLMVASLLHYFDWTLPNGLDSTKIDMKEKFVITLKKEKPLFLIPRLRKI